MPVLRRTLALSALLAVAPPAAAAAPGASAQAIAEYVRARLAEGAGDHAAAVTALRRALVHDPASPQLHVVCAEALARAGELAAAEAEARRALELAPSGPATVDARLALGRVLAQAHRPREALPELEAAAQLEGAAARAAPPQARDLDPEPWRELAHVRQELGDVAGAAQACEDLAALDAAEGAAAFRELAGRLADARDADGAQRQLERAARLLPNDPETLKLLARVEELRGRDAEARGAWERALAADPDDPDALLAAGQLALRKGDLAAARGWLRRLLEVAPDDAVRGRVAALFIEAKQPAEALEAADGDDARLAYLRGLALEQLRRFGDAAAAYGDVPASAGELYVSARAALGHALAQAGKPAEAIRAVKKGLAAQPRDPTLLYALGEAYDRAGNRDAALEQMRAVLALKPDHAEAMNFLGYSYAERGERLDEAQALVERALQLDPDNGYYLDSLGWILFKRGDYARAVSALEKADRLAGPEATILDHLGDAYRRAQRPADAARAWRRALAAPDPDDERARASRRAGVERKLRDLPGDTRAAQSRR